ncbi:(Fe-S)-binding protein [Aromatoleum toluvorans]|uniref:(Fe-S)-binding protein n=1 Tax=Aromatoleum toluvorans TaxID=92002 RepID=A0ABX1PVA8_9RHOO|nr:(Fe-S)-binding protein [Aromatoleum toluvorans]NMG43352.1 (Fe-S)-binding protein [Aromatoleum toluvorans]
MTETPTRGPRVGLFATCLMNVFRPNVGFSAVKLLEDAGCTVEVPANQTCCGQPGYNSGDYDAARALARQVIEAFEHYDYIVGPSGSCMATIRHDYPVLFQNDDVWRPRAQALSEKSWELLSFLADVLHAAPADARYDGTVTYHDSCSGLRGLGIKGQPRALLGEVDGLKLKEMEDSEVCCGFGGTFCVKYPEISEKMVEDKVRNILASGADTLVGGDLGCLMNIAGRLKRIHAPVKVFHTAEVLAGLADGPGLAGAAKEAD